MRHLMVAFCAVVVCLLTPSTETGDAGANEGEQAAYGSGQTYKPVSEILTREAKDALTIDDSINLRRSGGIYMLHASFRPLLAKRAVDEVGCLIQSFQWLDVHRPAYRDDVRVFLGCCDLVVFGQRATTVQVTFRSITHPRYCSKTNAHKYV